MKPNKTNTHKQSPTNIIQHHIKQHMEPHKTHNTHLLKKHETHNNSINHTKARAHTFKKQRKTFIKHIKHTKTI